ncbi:MAG TPA: DNA primase [Dissulfurispiraceae bacterium]|nr:DNA primase [Dissulfurispiraceae bacterium]
MGPDDLREEIKARIDIVDLVGEYVDLKKAGQNYKGLCPFHPEKTPSFMVSPSKQIFHCFGCHKGGDIFTFVMEQDHLTFPEALTALGRRAGVNTERLRSGSSRAEGMRQALYEAQREAMLFFRDNLVRSDQCRAYLADRAIDAETEERFSLGYSVRERDALLRHLTGKGFSADQIRASGVVSTGERGQFDFFRDRLMFPIVDGRDRVVAFGGRILTAQPKGPKYLNSPDSAIFRKGESLYGINHARTTIARKGYAIIVEGYFDVIRCHQHGFTNTVAPLGTALTAGQAKALKKYAKNILLVFDGDAAGLAAAKRALEIVFSEGMTAKILRLPEGEDPDTFLRKHGDRRFKSLMGKALSPVDFVLTWTTRNKIDAVRFILGLLSASQDPLQRDDTLRELSERSKIPEKTLREELRASGRRPAAGQRSPARDDGMRSDEGMRKEVELILNILVEHPGKAWKIAASFDPGSLGDTAACGIIEKVRSIVAEDPGSFSLQKLLDACTTEEQRLITGITMGPDIDDSKVDEVLGRCLRTIALRGLEKKIAEAGESGDAELLKDLFAQKREIAGASGRCDQADRPPEGP